MYPTMNETEQPQKKRKTGLLWERCGDHSGPREPQKTNWEAMVWTSNPRPQVIDSNQWKPQIHLFSHKPLSYSIKLPRGLVLRDISPSRVYNESSRGFEGIRDVTDRIHPGVQFTEEKKKVRILDTIHQELGNSVTDQFNYLPSVDQISSQNHFQELNSFQQYSHVNPELHSINTQQQHFSNSNSNRVSVSSTTRGDVSSPRDFHSNMGNTTSVQCHSKNSKLEEEIRYEASQERGSLVTNMSKLPPTQPLYYLRSQNKGKEAEKSENHEERDSEEDNKPEKLMSSSMFGCFKLVESDSEEEPQYSCGYCEKSFNSKQGLYGHIKIHPQQQRDLLLENIHKRR
eukprot:TRINITY_DN9603_c0_g1_i2.p1 TRINITY_DN9603_c0_g1~~TRINITY_DN9603_c0_g1_i2.p1  ORF type:complete len:368 (+),score=79.64 TRINITY_DN9603_c0_g1_i2:78-1106(+)